MALTSPHAWVPSGIADLEPVAWEALSYDGSACVAAGPGAGKTEFLAQRACYLLETGGCPLPQRILAIAFKTDSARNVGRRVQSRAPDHGRRFTSMTFDAFTKGLVDRFRASLPPYWRPRSTYTLDVRLGDRQVIDRYLKQLGGTIGQPASITSGISRSAFLPESLGGYRLSSEPDPPTSAEEFALMSWWEDVYVNADPQLVEFTMLNRLAELAVRVNPQIRRALRMTYPFVFVDEFQDTTYAQYDFLRSVFGGGSTIVTVVGDNKQRIMGWAGAMDDAFNEFLRDFGGRDFHLQMNHRSSQDLVKIQHVVAKALDQRSTPAVSGTTETVNGAASEIWCFATEDAEAHEVSRWIAEDLADSDRVPSDYALLTRQKPDVFESRFSAELARYDIAVRNDSLRIGRTTLQDLLVDDLTLLILGMVRLSATRRNPRTWSEVCTTMTAIRGVDPFDEPRARAVVDEIGGITRRARKWMAAHPPTPEHAVTAIDRFLEIIGPDAVKRTFTAYRDGDAFMVARDALRHRLSDIAATTSDWVEACDLFLGVNSVPLMTVHKSKGLEYHTVVFLGIDDGQWWAHRPGQLDGLATFFVGLSRAAQRAMFTFCSARGARNNVRDLYDLLRSAGVKEIEM